HWEDEWIETAENLVREEYAHHYEHENDAVESEINDAVPQTADNTFDFGDISVGNEAERISELEEYLHSPVEKVKDPVQWWFSKRHVYPKLSRMALDYLSIPAALVKDLMAWKPKDRDNKKNTPDSLLALEFDDHHETLKRDYKGKSRDVAKLMEPYNSGNYDFLVDRSGGRHHAVMEFTLVNKKPKKGAFAAVSTNTISFEDDSEQYWLGAPHRLRRWVTAVRVEHELKAVRMIQRLLRARIPSLDDSDRDSADDENFDDEEHSYDDEDSDEGRHSDESERSDNDEDSDHEEAEGIEPSSITLYAWTYEDSPESESVRFSAVVPSDLDKLKVWKPKDKENVDGLPELLDLDLAEHEFIEEDVEGRSRDIAELFQPFIENEKKFWLRADGKPDFALLEVTVSKDQPEDNPFVAVDIASAYYHCSKRSTSHFKAKDTGQEHYLQKQDFCYITDVQVNRDAATAKMAQRQAHKEKPRQPRVKK
ncbi:hypothetical protein EWM64_g10512, partial [Hericium alpestre]